MTPDKAQPWSVRFRQEREGGWRELEILVGRALSSGLKALSPEQLRRLPVLYRAALSSLAVARRTALDRALVSYLEDLAARAYLAVYSSRRPAHKPLRRFVAVVFPRSVRALYKELALATLCFALGIVLACCLTLDDSQWFYAFVSADMASGRDPGAETAKLSAALYDGAQHDGAGLSAFASYLFTHNAKVGMMAFALGFAAGVPTVLLLFANGLTMGAFIALYARRGLLFPLLGWLLPHGVPEIMAMLLCGAAGLALGRAVIFPGALRARDALKVAGRRASLVVLGSVLLFAVAGVVEGIFRQVVQDDVIRYAVAAFNMLWLAAWLVAAGRGAGPAKAGEMDHGL